MLGHIFHKRHQCCADFHKNCASGASRLLKGVSMEAVIAEILFCDMAVIMILDLSPREKLRKISCNIYMVEQPNPNRKALDEMSVLWRLPSI